MTTDKPDTLSINPAASTVCAGLTKAKKTQLADSLQHDADSYRRVLTLTSISAATYLGFDTRANQRQEWADAVRDWADDTENARLRKALEDLVDQQNGPPLVRDAEAWQAAMDQAQVVLGYTAVEPGQEQ